jgi:hypothetical protein
MHCTLLVLHGALGRIVEGKDPCARLQTYVISRRQRFRVCARVRVRACTCVSCMRSEPARPNPQLSLAQKGVSIGGGGGERGEGG